MEKVFEALKTIKIKCHPNSNPSPLVDGALEIIEQALKELQAIKEVKISDALFSFRGFKEGMITDNSICITKSYFDAKFPIIEQALLKAQEQEKVPEVIKKKKVDIKLVLWAGNMVEAYNQQVREQKDYWWREELTQEEFDLLKRWCEK